MACNKQKYCSGCRNNFYNGNNDLGVSKCWSLANAKVVWRKFVHVDQVPPWNNKPERTLSCHSRPRFVSVDPKVNQ
jgi:hypothetical protein